MTEKCGRPTKSDAPCKITRLVVTRGFWPAAIVHEVPACRMHATPEERAGFDQIAAAVRAEEERRVLEYHQSVPVECWDWPVTDDDRRRAAEARACEDPDEARTLACNLLADWQNHRCAVCKGRSEVLDHDHKTGLVRGWLCRFCNAGEGSPVHIPGGQFERYREKNPASMLGIGIRYYSPFTGWAEPDQSPEEKFAIAARAAYALGEIWATRDA